MLWLLLPKRRENDIDPEHGNPRDKLAMGGICSLRTVGLSKPRIGICEMPWGEVAYCSAGERLICGTSARVRGIRWGVSLLHSQMGL
jgi:hypothetical protein